MQCLLIDLAIADWHEKCFIRCGGANSTPEFRFNPEAR